MEVIILGLIFMGWLWYELSGERKSDRNRSGYWYGYWRKQSGLDSLKDQGFREPTEDDMSDMTALLMYDDFMEDGDLDLF